MEYDPARHILGGDWQLPTKEIWKALVDNSSTNSWDDNNKGYKFENNSKTLFLPAAGGVYGTLFNYVDSYGLYWSGTANSSTVAFYLYFKSSDVTVGSNGIRCNGFTVRPVRLVAVN